MPGISADKNTVFPQKPSPCGAYYGIIFPSEPPYGVWQKGAYMENIIWGVLLTLVAGLLVWLGVRHRKKARQQYEADSRRCTAVTAMTIESLEASEEVYFF